MSILKDLIKETAAGGAVGAGAMGVTSAHNVAGIRTPLGFNKSKKKKKKGKKAGPVGNIYSFKFVEGYKFTDFLKEADDSDFDASDVIAKLKHSEQQAEDSGEDTTAFALEDENGQLVKVWVPDDQADDFESALEQALSKGDEDNDDENDQKEIAEVIWHLRKDFDIVNVEWGGDIPQDEEQEVATPPAEGGPLPGETGAELHGDETPEPGAEGEGLGDEEGLGGEEGEDMEAEPDEAAELGGEEDTKSTLQSIIDMMKADAEARMADANARAAEAKAREAEMSMQQAKEKVKQEEEILDMETYYDKQKEEKDEADRLAKLAKYKHDLAAEKGIGPTDAEATPEVEIDKDVDVNVEPEPELPQEDNEWTYRDYGGHGGGTHMSKAELGDLIIKALRRN